MRTPTCLLASLLLSAASAPASTFSVTGSGSTFTITRSGDTSAAETVLYRTVPLTAFPGQHYTEKSGTLVFAPGQTTTNVVVSERSPSSPFNYQVVSSRAYRLQILDPVGTNLVYCLRSRSVGSAVGSSLFAQKSATIDTAAFTVTDGGYHQTGNPHTFNVSSFYDSDQRSYLSYVSAQLHATLEFQSKEVEDGYQYLQVLVDNTTGYDSKNDADKGDPGTPTLSSYMAGFEMNTGSADTTYRTYSFPVTSVGSDEGASNPWGYSSDGKYPLSKQKFNTNCRASDGKIVVSNGFSTLSVRFDASGSNNDNWMAKNLVAKFTAHESTKPYIRSGTVVAPGPYRHGTEFYVSVPFSEIVTTSGTPKLHTSWGDLSCLSTSDSNVLTFKGTIAADVDTPLVIRCISGTVTDLAGNALTGTNVNANLSCTVGYPWPGAGTEQDAYVITTAAQLDYLAARVNAGTWFTNTCFELGADIAYSHAATDWDTITSSGDCENNFTPIGGHGHSFRGTFDGKGHTVSGIRVFKEDNDDTDHSDESLGLFGFVSDGTVKNVFLRDANIHGKRNLGGIVGYLSGGVVTNCLLYNVRVSTGSTRFNVYVDVGYNSGTIDGNRYRDCCIGQKPAQASGELINVRQDNLFAVAPADDVAAAFASGESAAIDGTNYYTAGSAFALSYTGAVPANWSVVYAATGGATVNGSTLTLASADATVSASVVPPAAYAAHWQAGADHDGTSAKPYVITTPAGLELLSAEVNAGTGFSGTYFRLGADIDMGTVATFDPIGRYNSKPFAGNFNGGGYAIRNLTVNIADGTCAGLFGRVDGSVANLTLGDATITGYNFTGGIVGSLYASDATLDNCHVVRSVITCANQLPTVGAIVGTLHGTAAGCTYHSTIVRAPNDTGDHFQADGDAFNIGTGTYYAPSRFRGDISGAAFDPSCLLLPTNAPSLRADLIAAYADPAAHTAYGGAAPDLSGLVVTSGVTRLYAVTNAAPAGLSVSGTDVVLAGLGRSYFAPGDAVALVAPAGYAIAAASYTDASGAHDIEPAAAFAYSFPMPASDVTVAATLAPTSGYCGRADANGGQNVAWSFDLATGALAVTTNAAAVGTDFSMADYAWADRDATPWATLRPYVRSVTIAPGVTSVGDYAFDGCTALAALSIGGDVARIGEGTFENCTALEAVFIPGSVASIGFSSFSGCTALATVTGGANVTRIGGYAFGSLGWSNDNTTPWLRAQPAGVVYLGKVAIAFQSGGGTAVEIAPGTVSIAEETFMFAPVTSVVIPESVVHIGTSAFFSCNALRAVYLLSAAPPALDDPDDLFADEFGEPISDQLFYVRGTAYADAWSGVWGWMGNNPAWTDANRIVIGTVSCADGITASGTPAVTYGGTNYYAAGTAIALAGEPPVPDPVPAGYTDQLAGYAVNGLPVGVSFAMPERDVTVTPRWAVVDFETGHAGTEQDPYVIYNKDQLDLLAARVNGGKIYNGKFIRLGADIAYDPTALDENGENYTAIGGYHDGGSKSFRGTFDGDGHTVRGIRINKTGDSNADGYQGLFGEVDNGTIRNVTLANSVFGGFYYLGGIVGYQYNGAIVNCRVESDVIIKAGAGGAYSHGGIAGTVAGIGNLLGCFSAATVTDDQNSGSRYYGGIVGTNKGKGAVKDCFVLCGTVSAYSDSGAIAGDKYNLASFTNNYYAACTVNGTTNATNVGCGDPAGDIDGARYAHTITLGPGVRIVGEETVYSNSCLTAIDTSALRYTGGGTNVIYSGAGQTVALAYDGVVPEGYAFVGFVVNGAAIDGDSFAMPDADVTVRADIAAIPWTGGGTAEDPYLIQYPSQLDLLAANVNGGVTNYAGAFFLQVADLVYDSTTNNYTPVGYGVFAFGGTYDGGGHIVSGINVTWTDGFDSNNGIGLFGGVNSGTVRNVTVADSVFVGNGEAGGVAGYVVEAVVSNCCVEGSVVIGTGAVQTYCHGGIVGGGTSSAIVGCFSAAAVTSNAGDEFFGGIAGLFYGGRIENCLYGGTVQSAGITGAILGYAFVSMPVLCNNLYTADGLPGGFNGNDTDGARRAHTITLGERVRIVGEETVYDASGLAAIGTSALRYTGGGTNVIYGGAGETVTLVYDGVPPEGYAFVGFVVNGVAVDGESFEMPAAAVTVAAEIITDWEALNRRLAAGGTVTLDKDYTATAEDTYLTVPEGVAVTLDLNGHILDRNLAAATNLGCVIEVRGSLAVTDGAPAATHTGALEGIPGGIVTGGNTTGDGGGVHVNGSAAIFTLSGGTIADNAAQHGGGVYVYKGSFTLSGGTITNNTAKYGGGVYVGNGSFTLSGGAVSENDASSYGGGVYVNGGTATLSGGAVTGNAANGGGGVYMYSGTVALSGGAVSGNAARYGGGVYLYRGTATLSGGAVSENTASSYGGGVYVANYSSTLFQIGGGPVVSGNAVGGEPNNVHLESGKHIDVTEELTASARLGVTAADGPGVFTAGLSGNGGAENFFSDDPVWRVRVTSGGEAELFVPDAFYAVVIGENAHGAVTASVNDSVVVRAVAGDTVVLVGDPAEGYGLRSVVVTNASGVAVATIPGTGGNAGGFVFEMPAASVGVEATFETVYPVAIAPDILHGTVAADRDAAFAGDVVTVTLAPDEGYALGSLSVADANGDPVWLLSQDGPEAQFEMPVGGAVVSARFAACVPASYVDENGEERTVQAILLEDWMTRLTEGFYVVTGEVACASRVMARGDVTLILADGCALRFGTPEAPLAGCAIDADLYDLAIYGQAGGTGRLEIYNANGYGIYVVGGYAQHGGCVLVRTSGWHDCIYTDGSVVLDGGSLDVESESGRDIYAAGDIRIRGGRLSASGGGLYADSITLGHRSPTDSIYAADYSYRASSDGLKVAQALTDGTNVYTRRVEPVEIAGKTLTPVYRVIVGTTFIGEGRGRATAGKDYFAAGETVALAIVPASGSALGSLDVYYSGDDGYSVAVAVTNNAFTMPARDVRVTARFVPGYTVSFLPGEGGGEMASVAVPQDAWYTLPDCGFAEPEGKMFVGWLSGGGNTYRPGEEQQIDGDWTLTAIFAGYRTATIAGDGADGVRTEWSWWDATVSETGFAGVATGGVARFPRGADLNFSGLPLFIDSDPALDYHANSGIYSLADATNDVTIAIAAQYAINLAGYGYERELHAYARGVADERYLVASAPSGAVVYVIGTMDGGGGVVRSCTVTGLVTGVSCAVEEEDYGFGAVGCSFTMPAEPVDVWLAIESPVEISYEDCAHGGVSGPAYAFEGDLVTLVPVADEGWAPVGLAVTYEEGYETRTVAVTNNQFTMPAEYVTVTATFAPVVLPAYLAGADDVVTNNYLAWAAKYGSDAEGSYESCFLLDLPPWTEMPEGAALLKIVEMGTTNIPTASDYGMIAMAMGYEGEELPCRRLVLASDVAQLKRREGFDTPFEACNGYLVLRIGGDLAAPLDEWLAMSWLVEFEDGRGEIVFPELFMEGIRGNLERAAGRPLGGLFLRPCISPVASLEWISNIGILIEGP